MLDKNGHNIEIGNKVWLVGLDLHLWEVTGVSDKVEIKNTETGEVSATPGEKVLKHAT